MKSESIRVFLLLLCAGMIFLLPLKADDIRATVQGKYSGLIQRVSCPQDLESYGDFNDWGWWSGNAYCGQQVSTGWWVYSHPDWYIWRHNAEIPPAEPELASVDGKYAGLLGAVVCPGDRRSYGEFNDYGYWGESDTYCGHRVPAGFWVYKHPYWYIWNIKTR